MSARQGRRKRVAGAVAPIFRKLLCAASPGADADVAPSPGHSSSSNTVNVAPSPGHSSSSNTVNMPSQSDILTSGSDEPAILPGVYVVMNVGGRCVLDLSADDGTTVIGWWDFHASRNQQWEFSSRPQVAANNSRQFSIRSMQSRHYVAPSKSVRDIQCMDVVATDWQFEIEQSASQAIIVRIVWLPSGKVLTCHGRNLELAIKQSRSVTQLWQLVRVRDPDLSYSPDNLPPEPTAWSLVTGNDENVVTSPNSSHLVSESVKLPISPVLLAPKKDQVSRLPGDWFIINVGLRLALDLSTVNNIAVIGNDPQGADNQKWEFLPQAKAAANSSTQFSIRSRLSQCCMAPSEATDSIQCMDTITRNWEVHIKQYIRQALVVWITWPRSGQVLTCHGKNIKLATKQSNNANQLWWCARFIDVAAANAPTSSISPWSLVAPDYYIDLRPSQAACLQSILLTSSLHITVKNNIASIPDRSIGELLDTLHKKFLAIQSGGPDEQRRRTLGNLFVHLCYSCRRFPSSVMVTGVQLTSLEHVAGGGYADIYEAKLGDVHVALKRFRAYSSEDLNCIRECFCREVFVWHALDHPNVTPFLGLDEWTFRPSLCMVSPWMRNGNMLQYAVETELSPSRLNQLLVQTIDGLDYLHSQSIIHGDLRCNNILVNDAGKACLTDFGLAKLVSDSSMATSTNNHGSHRWNAPEVYSANFNRRTEATDIYAFGCVCLELHTRKPPFAQISQDFTVMASIMQGGKPEPPTELNYPGAKNMWVMVEKCWDADSSKRPALHRVRGTLLDCV